MDYANDVIRYSLRDLLGVGHYAVKAYQDAEEARLRVEAIVNMEPGTFTHEFESREVIDWTGRVVNLTQALRNITVEGGSGSIYTRNVFVDNQIAMKIRESVLKIIADNADNTEVN